MQWNEHDHELFAHKQRDVESARKNAQAKAGPLESHTEAATSSSAMTPLTRLHPTCLTKKRVIGTVSGALSTEFVTTVTLSLCPSIREYALDVQTETSHNFLPAVGLSRSRDPTSKTSACVA